MCLTRPQSHTDYFCGRACREESLNKHYEVTDEEEGGELGEEEDDGTQGLGVHMMGSGTGIGLAVQGNSLPVN